jgi:type II secretory pathway component PulK
MGERGARNQAERGIALILSLLLLSILIILVTEFGFSVTVDQKIARNSSDEVKALYAARGSLAYVRAFLRDDRKKTKVDSMREDWDSSQGKLTSVQVGDTAVTLKVEDAERRFNINLAFDDATRPFAKAVLTNLANHLGIGTGGGTSGTGTSGTSTGGTTAGGTATSGATGMPNVTMAPDEIAERIVDFIAAPKDGKYLAGAKGAPLASVEELLGVPELPPQVLLGVPAQGTQPEYKGLLDYLTVWGSRKININTMTLDLAWAIIPDTAGSQKIDASGKDDAVSKIDDFRTGGQAAQSGGTTSGATSTGSTSAGTSGVGTTTAGGMGSGSGSGSSDVPGQDFQTVDQLGQVVTALAPALTPAGAARPGQQPGAVTPPAPATGGTKGTAAAPTTAFRDELAVTSLDFHIDMTVSVNGTSRRYEAVIRRGTDHFDTLFWREVAQ